MKATKTDAGAAAPPPTDAGAAAPPTTDAGAAAPPPRKTFAELRDEGITLMLDDYAAVLEKLSRLPQHSGTHKRDLGLIAATLLSLQARRG